MEEEQTYRILKLVEEGILTADQGKRILEELKKGGSRDEKKTGTDSSDFFQFMERTAATIGAGLDSVLKSAGTSVDGLNQQVRGILGLGPQNLNLRVIRMDDGQVRLSLNFPLKLFMAFKGLLIQQKTSPFPLPLPPVDFELIFQALEADKTGKIFEAVDHDKKEILEIWVQ